MAVGSIEGTRTLLFLRGRAFAGKENQQEAGKEKKKRSLLFFPSFPFLFTPDRERHQTGLTIRHEDASLYRLPRDVSDRPLCAGTADLGIRSMT